MFSVEFYLKQRMPIIHFQSGQFGATLRATELKPKLDRLIAFKLESCFKDLYQKHRSPIDQVKKLFGDSETPVLSPYRISIEDLDENPEYYYFETRFGRNDNTEQLKTNIGEVLGVRPNHMVAPSPFFANNDKRPQNVQGGGRMNESNLKAKEGIRLGIMSRGPIVVTFRSFDKQIIDLVTDTFPILIATENFGMRQTKGFGGYEVGLCSGSNVTLYDENKVEPWLKGRYDLVKRIKAPDGIANILKFIDDEYRTLRNRPPSDSALRDYFHDLHEDLTWEKPFVNNAIINKSPHIDPNNYRFVRAVMGLAGLHDYAQLKRKVKIEHIGVNSAKIERFRSPIIFKLYGTSLYLCVDNKSIRPILNQQFKFSEAGGVSGVLSTPEEFNMVNFIDENLTRWKSL